MRWMRLRVAFVTTLGLLAGGALGCAEERDPINRVQDQALDKTVDPSCERLLKFSLGGRVGDVAQSLRIDHRDEEADRLLESMARVIATSRSHDPVVDREMTAMAARMVEQTRKHQSASAQ